MRLLLLSLACAGLAGSATAADPPPAPPCAAKICVAVPTTKQIDKVIYEDRCVDFCLPHCSLWSILGYGCGDVGCVLCGRPHTRHVLIKKYIHEECPDAKCEVHEGSCRPPCGSAR